jgi:hypothetical protein
VYNPTFVSFYFSRLCIIEKVHPSKYINFFGLSGQFNYFLLLKSTGRGAWGMGKKAVGRSSGSGSLKSRNKKQEQRNKWQEVTAGAMAAAVAVGNRQSVSSDKQPVPL